MSFKKNILLYTILPLFILFVGSSYLRFVINMDYLVSYEGHCEPQTGQSCFLYCEDEECTEPSYYSIIERRADTLHALCGKDISNCEKAYQCPEDEQACSVTFCTPGTDTDCANFENTNANETIL